MKNIKVLIWDFDGTLYKPQGNLFNAVRESEYRTIMEVKHWPREKAILEFEKLYKTVTPSATQTVARICGMTTTEAARYLENFFDRRTFLYRDNKLISLFQSLSRFTHFILANGVQFRIRETLGVMGIPLSTFEEIVTSEISGENKPSDKGFRYIMGKTGLAPAAHLMIGDRDAVDLAPAKALGMHTCRVWSEEKSEVADVTLSTVYDVAGMFL